MAHGYAALYYGDETAKNEGRLTLNPLKHLDMFGSILLPLFLFISGSPYMVGWAKPVPYNPNNLRDSKYGKLAVASAGIIVNLIIVIIFVLLIKIFQNTLPLATLKIFSLVVLVNLILASFNLLPVPPLDGSKIIAHFGNSRIKNFVEAPTGGFIIVSLVVAIFLWQIIMPFVFKIYTWLV